MSTSCDFIAEPSECCHPRGGLPFRRIQLHPLARTARFTARTGGLRGRLLDGAPFPCTGDLPGMREVAAAILAAVEGGILPPGLATLKAQVSAKNT